MYAAASNVDGILCTCSACGSSIEQVQNAGLGVPILTPIGGNIGVSSTFAPTLGYSTNFIAKVHKIEERLYKILFAKKIRIICPLSRYR
mmetsp:Transcript_37963/g.74346  ORF Transcript_37963/g.74346 Transcript_37963/m.74346 type:complete len:89 (-) Transcript_37963:165-431(-)